MVVREELVLARNLLLLNMLLAGGYRYLSIDYAKRMEMVKSRSLERILTNPSPAAKCTSHRYLPTVKLEWGQAARIRRQSPEIRDRAIKDGISNELLRAGRRLQIPFFSPSRRPSGAEPFEGVTA